jgi:F0F1-type ATP synthase assembly protein I
VLTALIGACTLAGVALGLLGAGWAGAWAGLALLAGEAIYLIIGLLLARAPARVWLALLYAPVFVVWKVVLYLRVLAGRERQGWIRTER